jgi:hypothetical protein
MIVWPQATGDAQKALDSFKKSSLAAELDDDAQKWRFRSFARSPAPPARMVLRNDAGATRLFTLEPTGFWVGNADHDASS